jgi:hypothetical protein
MAEHKVNVVHLKAAQRVVDAFDDVLVRQAGIVGSVAPPEDLGRDDDALTPPAELLDRIAHDPFGFAAGVGLGVVEEVDAGVVGGRHAFAGDIEADLPTVRDPGAKRQLAQLDTRLA